MRREPGRLDYRLRVSTRARKLWLRVTIHGGLEVVVPRRYDLRRVPQVLEQERAWIQSALARVERRRAALADAPPWAVPHTIELPAVGLQWDVKVRPTSQGGIRVREVSAGQLELVGRVAEAAACRRALERWLAGQGRQHLVPWLHRLSGQIGIGCERVAIRLQRTLWGSYSSRGLLSLNARLLLLPAALVDYVMVHELCHARHLSHSRRFWGLVARFCPDHLRLRAELRQAGKRLPSWAADRFDRG